MIRTLAAIAAFGTLGCWARYGQTLLMQEVYGSAFPIALLSINVLGAFFIGFLFVETAERLAISPATRTGILTGLLGGYTSFSSFELDTYGLLQHGEALVALAYVFLSIVLGFIAAFVGVYIARNL